jgi:RNA polymerase sigma factor (TIGR02999 family)
MMNCGAWRATTCAAATESHSPNNRLVHEAFLRLAEGKSLQVKDRRIFSALAAQLMRWILVDYERNRHAAKRGAGVTRLSLDPGICEVRSNGEEVDLLALNEALDRLAKLDAQQSRIVELRYFGGLTVEDTSEFFGYFSCHDKTELVFRTALACVGK